jgi:hypothetical protein
MSDFQLTTPVVFIVFNRPDTTERVFAEIARAKPPKLLVVGDGPRIDHPGEAEKVAATRAIIEKVDWPCEVLTNYSNVNLGCKNRVSTGIDWVFSQVEEAIILEDDCLPDPSFFRFCQELLVYFRHDQRIGMISGDNFQFGRKYGQDSYYFSKYVHIWGWATWRNRWCGVYDVKMECWPKIRDQGCVANLVGNAVEAKYWFKNFERTYNGKIDTWDYQWNFANWLNGRLSIMPSVNLISNIGFGLGATHTTGDSDVAAIPVQSISFPLAHPVGVFRNLLADEINYNNCCKVSMLKKVRYKIVSLIRIFKAHKYTVNKS